jgi:hypothetical protein
VNRRGLAALGAGCAALILLLVAIGGRAAEPRSSQAQPDAGLAGAIQEAIQHPRRGASPEADVSEGQTLRERIDRGRRAGAIPEVGGDIEKIPARTSCSRALRRPIVDVMVTGAGCGIAARLAEAYRPGSRAIGDFTCTADGLRIDCSRSSDPATVVLLLGPGGEGLEDCGQSPLDERATLGFVRAQGVSCDEARRLIFAAIAAGEPLGLKGFACGERAVSGTATIGCRRRDEAVAYSVPPGL